MIAEALAAMKISRWLIVLAAGLFGPVWALAAPLPSPSPSARPELKELILTLELSERVRESVSKGTTPEAYAKQMTLLMPQLDDVLYGMRHLDPMLLRHLKQLKNHHQAAWEVWESKGQRTKWVVVDYIQEFDRLWEDQIQRFPGIRSGVKLQPAPGGGKMIFLPDIINWHWRQADFYLDAAKTLVPMPKPSPSSGKP